MSRSNFDGEMIIIDKDEIDNMASPWGNAYYLLTEEHIDALRKGKVLCDACYELSEYGTFIMLKNDEKENK